MIYLDPRSDIVFKKLFGDITHKNILISFLNSVLNRQGNEQIVDVIMNNPNNHSETVELKSSAVDVKCTDQNNNQYIVEMQIINQKDYAARAQYYSSLALSRQLGLSEQYSKLVPVIFVGILNFKLFQNQNYLSSHFILDSKTYAHELKHLEFHFVELEKFDKKIDQLDIILDKWIYFLKYAFTLEQIPNNFKDLVFKDAFDVIAQSNWSVSELDAYFKYVDAIRSSKSQLETAEERGVERGINQGKNIQSIEIAKRLLKLHDIATIAQITGLSIKEVESLKDENR